MQAAPVTPAFTPKLAVEIMQIIEAGGKALGVQSWASALEGMQLIQQAMQAAAQADQQRIADLEAKAQPKKEVA